MPLLGTLLTSIASSFFGLIAAMFGARIAIRLTAVATLAAIYVSCVVYFTQVVGPWMGSVFASQYGQLLGLLFPPISGSILAGLSAYWVCITGLKYVSSLTKMAVG